MCLEGESMNDSGGFKKFMSKMILKGRNINPRYPKPFFYWPKKKETKSSELRHISCLGLISASTWTVFWATQTDVHLPVRADQARMGLVNTWFLTTCSFPHRLSPVSVWVRPIPVSGVLSFTICMPWICRTPVVSFCTAACKWETSANLPAHYCIKCAMNILYWDLFYGMSVQIRVGYKAMLSVRSSATSLWAQT